MRYGGDNGVNSYGACLQECQVKSVLRCRRRNGQGKEGRVEKRSIEQGNFEEK
jgi:hypothetical protein